MMPYEQLERKLLKSSKNFLKALLIRNYQRETSSDFPLKLVHHMHLYNVLGVEAYVFLFKPMLIFCLFRKQINDKICSFI